MRSALHTVLVCVAVSSVAMSHAMAEVTISEVLADPPDDATGDVNHDGIRSFHDDEFVELVNTGSQPADLSNWSLSDSAKVRHTFAANTVLAPGETIVVFSGGKPQGFQGKVVTASSGSLSLNNNGDVLTLRDATKQVRDSLSYSKRGEKGQSLVRNRDGELVLHSSIAGNNGALFSPGRATKQ